MWVFQGSEGTAEDLWREGRDKDLHTQGESFLSCVMCDLTLVYHSGITEPLGPYNMHRAGIIL